MWNDGLDEAQAGIKISGRNLLATLDKQMTESNQLYGRKQRGTEEPIDENERGEWKSWLKTQHSKKEDQKIMASSPIISWQIDGETTGTVTDFIFLAPKLLQMMTAANN